MVRKKILIANGGLCAFKFLLNNHKNRNRYMFIGLVRPTDLINKMKYIDFLHQYELVEDGPPERNFNNLDLILSIAVKYNVDYVWPGYGHLSENYHFPMELEKLKIKFIGPSHSAMKILGNKISANALAKKLKIPTIPFLKIKKKEELEKFAFTVKYPIMIRKANEGGGRGITYLENQYDISNNLFTDDKNIFAIKYLKNVRHIEIQGVADRKNNIIILDSRDCTLQRRYQKLMEEAPQIICDEQIVEEMKNCSIKLLREVKYEGLATIEWLYDLNTGKFYFLEVNCRLQVEHPCTEILYGIKLCALQLKIAEGLILKNMNFKKRDIHVTSARILAENYMFMAQTGAVFIDFTIFKNVKYYFAFSKGIIDEMSDSQFGHIFAIGKNRKNSLKNLYRALNHIKIEGIDSSIFFNKKIIRDKNYTKNNFNTKSAEKFLIKISFKKIYFFPIIYFLKRKIKKLNFIYENEEFFSDIYFLSDNRLICNLNNQYTYHEFTYISNNSVIIDGEYIEYIDSEEYYRLKYRKYNLIFYFSKANQIAKNSFKLLKYYIENNQAVKKGDRILLTESMKTEQNFYAPFDGILQKIKKENEFVQKDEKYCIIKSSNENSKIYEHKILIDNAILVNLTVESIEKYYLPPILFRFSNTLNYLREIKKITNYTAFNEYIQRNIESFTFCMQYKDMIIQLILENKYLMGLELLYKKVCTPFNLKKKRDYYLLKISNSNLKEAIAFIKIYNKTNIYLYTDNHIPDDIYVISNIKKVKITVNSVERIIKNNFKEELIYDRGILIDLKLYDVHIKLNNKIRKLVKRRNNFNEFIFYFLIGVYENNYKANVENIYLGDDKIIFTRNNSIKCGIDGYCITIEERKIIFIINNRNFINGSMGKHELKFYAYLTDYAVKINAMRIFVANNSGVRISIDEYFLENYTQLKNNLDYVPKSGNENLCYAALACKATIRARDCIPLISYIHNMSVGIGAYLARLGYQIIMERDSSLILTGFRALNKLMQEHRYNANTDLGGSHIMTENNICQKIVNDVFASSVYLFNYIKILYFCEEVKKFSKLSTCTSEHELIESLSNNTFIEFSEYYCEFIHTGRAIIDGNCFGIIFPEKPNVIDCRAAIKMKRALEIFNSENLPVLIIGNFKGFTGDHSEMAKGILSFGADLICSIEKYKKSIFIYIPAFGQLRGGSYVIFDKKLNKNIILIADKKSKIGILQPDGLKDIKRKICALNEESDAYINKLDDPSCLFKKNLIDAICKTDDLKMTIKNFYL